MTPTDRLLAAIQDIYATAVEVGEGRFEVDARRWAALAAALDAPTAPPAPPPATAPTADDATTVYTENYNRASGRGDSHEDAHEEALRALFDYAHDGGMADGARAERALAVAEDPQWDGTDAAHPAWWRGSDHAAKMMQRQLAERLGAPLDTCWQKLLDDVEARRAAAPAATWPEDNAPGSLSPAQVQRGLTIAAGILDTIARATRNKNLHDYAAAIQREIDGPPLPRKYA